MSDQQPEVIVAGHICIDIIPAFEDSAVPLELLLQPGKLTKVGPAVLSTGGAVSNTGLALHRLGVPVKLMGKISDDFFGQAVRTVLTSHAATLADSLIVSSDDASSYTLVINPPGVDRIFLHCPGANDTFGVADIALDALAPAKIFHFGYPPLMRRMFLDQGAELATLMLGVKQAGLITSLDMAQPDPASEAGRVDWLAVLERTLPFVDIFAPSLDETLFMLDRPRFDLLRTGQAGSQSDGSLLRNVGQRLLDLGAAIVALKLGNQGLYLRTAANPERMAALSGLLPADLTGWLDRELFTTCFRAREVGTTGAGDCTIAGLLAGLLRGLSIEAVLTSAVAVGACSVERADATSGVPHWDVVQARLRSGWLHHPLTLALDGWQSEDGRIWRGPGDRKE